VSNKSNYIQKPQPMRAAPVKSSEVRALLAVLKLEHEEPARLLGLSGRTMRNLCREGYPVKPWVVLALRGLALDTASLPKTKDATNG
jgi:hypothetical protein